MHGGDFSSQTATSICISYLSNDQFPSCLQYLDMFPSTNIWFTPCPPLVHGSKNMANQKSYHSDICTGGNGPFPQKGTSLVSPISPKSPSFFLAPSPNRVMLNVNYHFEKNKRVREELELSLWLAGWCCLCVLAGWRSKMRLSIYLPCLGFCIYLLGILYMYIYISYRWNQDFMHLTYRFFLLVTCSLRPRPSYLLTYLPAYLATYLSSYLPTY
jgi:hypothetical protein